MTWFKDHFHQHQYHHHLNITNAVYFIYMYMYVLCDLKILISQCEMTVMIKIFYIKDLLSSSLEHWVVKIPDLLNKGSFTYFIIFHSINRSGGCVDSWPIKRTCNVLHISLFFILDKSKLWKQFDCLSSSCKQDTDLQFCLR